MVAVWRRGPSAWLLMAALGIVLAGCDQIPEDARWARRQAALDPPELWSVEVVGQEPAGRPVLVCTDMRMRIGLRTAGPQLGGEPCRPVDRPRASAGGQVARCELQGRTWLVGSSWSGDLKRDYRAVFNMESLDGPRQRFRQERRLVSRGPCPAGWKVGDATDQQGRRYVAASAASQ